METINEPDGRMKPVAGVADPSLVPTLRDHGERRELVVALWDEHRFRALLQTLFAEQLERIDQRLQVVAEQPTARIDDREELRMISEKELARFLGCNPRTVRRLEHSGGVPPAMRIGGAKRWLWSEVAEWIERLPRRRT
jgi:predicted DNA-binding transcriptional regulator AlpA